MSQDPPKLARAHPRKASEATFGEPKCSRSKQEVAMTGHRKRGVVPGRDGTHLWKEEGNALASIRVQEGLENNEARCYSTDKVSKAREEHTVPPPVVQTSHSPPIPSPTHSKTRNDPSRSQTAAPSTQPCSFEGSCIEGFEELKLRHHYAVLRQAFKTEC